MMAGSTTLARPELDSADHEQHDQERRKMVELHEGEHRRRPTMARIEPTVGM